MHKRLSPILLLLLFFVFSFQSDALYHADAQSKVIPAPSDVLGFTPGEDRKLASWARVVEYFQKLDAASDRVKFEEIGKSTMGAPFVYATISAPENLKNLDVYKHIQALLADPRKIDQMVKGSKKLADSPSTSVEGILGRGMLDATGGSAEAFAKQLRAKGKTVVAITCGIHSTEVGSYLSSMLIAYRLASSNEPEVREILKDTIILLVPSTNPDGVDIVNNWYQKTLGTPYEGTDPPELYHHYTGHDDNRDWYAFTQVETQLVVDKILNIWHPQIVHDIHQQGAMGSRLFLPPYMQPVEPNVPQQIVEGYTELGNYLAKEMRAAGFKGITTNSTYDAWSPSRAYSHYHGGVRILQESASCRLATPIIVKFEQLQSREGYDPQKESANFGPLWRGGEWHLRDITNQMTTVAFLLLKHAAQNRQQWLQTFYEIERAAVRPRKNGELAGFAVPKLRDHYETDRLLNILHRGGVEIFESASAPRSRVQNTGDFVIPLAQPYGGFAKALLELQHYPNLRNDKGQPIAPYDVTAHSLALLMGIQAKSLTSIPVGIRKLTDIPPLFETIAPSMSSAWPHTSTAVYRSYLPAIDEGWTRFFFDSKAGRYTSIENKEIRQGNLYRPGLRTIIIPDQPRIQILNGHRKGTMPDEYTGGLGPDCVQALREFVEAGGTLVCLNRASDFAIEQFKLPVKDVVDGLPRTDFYVPGSILRIELDTSNRLAAGMPKESIAWVENSPVFELPSAGSADVLVRNEREARTEKQEAAGAPLAARVIAWYPKDKDPLLSGWLLGADRIEGKAALVEVELGKGRVILFGFRPQYRGQSSATYPLFFNAIAQH
jgi:hypothetical protein